MKLIKWMFSSLTRAIVSAVVLLVALIVGLNSFSIVQPGHAKVQVLFGKVRPEPLTEGFNLVNPFVSLTDYSIKDFTITWDNVKVPAEDKLKSGMDLAVTLRAKTNALPRMKQEAGNLQDAFDKYVSPRVYSLLRECGKGVEQSQDFFKDEVQNQMQDFMLANLAEQLGPLGFEVKVALFSDVTLPPLVQTAIENTKDRQEKVNQERAQLEIVALEQQKAVKIAEAKRDASLSTAQSIKNLADAEAYKTLTEAKAQAKANELLTKSVTAELVEYIRANSWDGKYPTTMLGESTAALMALK